MFLCGEIEVKMSDVFYGDVSVKHLDEKAINEIERGENSGNDWVIQDSNYWLATNKEHAEAACVAINMHDELVNELTQMKQFLEDMQMMSVNWTIKESQHRHKVVEKLLERCK